MWFRFSRPDYFYTKHYRVIDAGDGSPWNRGISIGFGFFILHCRWNVGRSESEGVHYPTQRTSRVTVNGTEWPVSGEAWSYETICHFAGTRPGATVTWRDRETGTGGALAPGERVMLKDGLVLNAVMTGAA